MILGKNPEKLSCRSPLLAKYFSCWLGKYSNCFSENTERNKLYNNKIIYDLNTQEDYKVCVIDFISGMTDKLAIDIYKELTTFR